MVRAPVFGGVKSDVLVIGDSLVNGLGRLVSDVEVVSVPGGGIDDVTELLLDNLAGRHKLVIVHVGTNNLSCKPGSRRFLTVQQLYYKLCWLRSLVPAGTHLVVSELFGRWSSWQKRWYALSDEELTAFNQKVSHLNSLLRNSHLSVLGHDSNYGWIRDMFSLDGLHLSSLGQSVFGSELAVFAKEWRLRRVPLLPTPSALPVSLHKPELPLDTTNLVEVKPTLPLITVINHRPAVDLLELDPAEFPTLAASVGGRRTGCRKNRYGSRNPKRVEWRKAPFKVFIRSRTPEKGQAKTPMETQERTAGNRDPNMKDRGTRRTKAKEQGVAMKRKVVMPTNRFIVLPVDVDDTPPTENILDTKSLPHCSSKAPPQYKEGYQKKKAVNRRFTPICRRERQTEGPKISGDVKVKLHHTMKTPSQDKIDIGLHGGGDCVDESQDMDHSAADESSSEDEDIPRSGPWFVVGDIFRTYPDFLRRQQAYMRSCHVHMFVRGSHAMKETGRDKNIYPHQSISFQCFFGQHKQKKGNGIRNTKTCRIGCPCSLSLGFDKTRDLYVVKRCNLEHNHALDPNELACIPAFRKLNGTEVNVIQPLLDQGLSSKMISQIARDKFNKPVLPKDIRNISQKQKGNSGSQTKELEKALNEIMELDSSCQTEVLELEGKTDVAGVFFQYSDMRKILENYGHMIFVDVTYSVNLEKYNLLTFLVADGENHGQPVGYAYICNESQPVLDLCFEAVRKSLKLSNREKVDIFMVDKDMKSIRSLQKVFPESKVLLCYFHVMKYMREKIRVLVDGSVSDKEAILNQIRFLINSKNSSEYENNLATLTDISPEIFIDYFRKNWDRDIKEWFVFHDRSHLLTIGNNTNNLLESHNKSLKRFLKSKHHLSQSVTELFKNFHFFLSNTAQKVHISQKLKLPANEIDCSVRRNYQQLLTHFAFTQVSLQMTVFEDDENTYGIEAVAKSQFMVSQAGGKNFVKLDRFSCDCVFYQNFNLPCHHLLAVLSNQQISLFSVDYVHPRFLQATAQETYPMTLITPITETHPDEKSDINIRKSKPMSQQEKFLFCQGLMANISDVMSVLPEGKFETAIDMLENFYNTILCGGEPVINKSKTVSESTKDVSSSEMDMDLSQDDAKDSESSSVISLGALNLQVPKAKKLLKKRITFYTKGKPKPQLKALTDHPLLDHNYISPSPTMYHPDISDADSAKILPSLPDHPVEQPSLKAESVENSSDTLVSDELEPDVELISESKETSYFPNLTSIPSKPYECSEAVYNSNASNVSKFLHSSEWLSDLEINSYQFLLANHSQNLKYDGFQDVVQITPENPVGGTCARKFIQIVNINKCHWITLSNVFSASDHEINVYDSLPLRKSKLTSEPIFPYALTTLASSLVRRKIGFHLSRMKVTEQKGSDDCGFFACAFATSLLKHQNPTNVDYDQAKLRSHFVNAIESKQISPFPSKSKRQMRYSSSTIGSKFVETYCVCNLADLENTLRLRMVECDSCKGHFHEGCVEIADIVWTDESVEFICPECKT